MTVPPRAVRQSMNGWEVLEKAIPRGEAEAVADLLGYSKSAVQRWRREPETDDETATGRRSPLDQLLLLINAVYLRNPEGAELIIERINSEIAKLRRIHGHAEELPINEVERELRAAMRTVGKVADRFAGIRANEKF